jgi:hypothetical protein
MIREPWDGSPIDAWEFDKPNCVRLYGYMWRSDVVEVLGGSRESHDVHRFIHHSSSIKLTRALPPIQQTVTTHTLILSWVL